MSKLYRICIIGGNKDQALRHSLMKAKIALLSLVSVLVTQVKAFTWDGTITETITSSNNAAYQIGQVFNGNYSYHSDDVNGTFYSTEYSNNWNPAGSNSSLTGSLALGLYNPQDGFNVTSYSMTSTPYVNYLSVVDGKVAGLFWQNQIGYSDPYFNGTTFSFYTGGPFSSLVTGTLQFSEPVDPPDPVPDASATFGLLAFSLGTLVILRRRFSV